jgi:hypothetical protein
MPTWIWAGLSLLPPRRLTNRSIEVFFHSLFFACSQAIVNRSLEKSAGGRGLTALTSRLSLPARGNPEVDCPDLYRA